LGLVAVKGLMFHSFCVWMKEIVGLKWESVLNIP
jgi:hypothetical protein